MRIYVDTNVFMDYLIERRYVSFFDKAFVNRWTLVYSDITLRELRMHSLVAIVENMLYYFQKECVFSTNEDIKCAKKLNTHFSDAMHIIIAQRAVCDYIVTSNVKDFNESKVKVVRPNDKI